MSTLKPGSPTSWQDCLTIQQSGSTNYCPGTGSCNSSPKQRQHNAPPEKIEPFTRGAKRMDTFQRREHHEQIGDAIAFVFVIMTRLASGRSGNGSARLDNHLLRGLVETHHRAQRVARSLIDVQHVFHVGDESRAGLGRNHPLLFEMRPEKVFLSVRPIVLSLAFSTMFNSTTFSSSRLSVHLA